ncbi:hypothetical protein FRB98_005646 [Tulasnella sp. 332]|nr:hypothetical protein FRB98_005646 [Tulasnella sp. 332]
MSTVKLAFRKFTNGVSDSVNDGQKKVKSVGPKAGHKINGQSLNDRAWTTTGEADREIERQRLEEDEKAQREETPEQRSLYGVLPIHQSQDRLHEKCWDIGSISNKDVGEEVMFRARVASRARNSSSSSSDSRCTPFKALQGTVWKPVEGVKGATVHGSEVKIRPTYTTPETNSGSSRSHTPKLQGGATESGASVFQAAYFGREAFLAQLAKQMCVAADFEKLYEVGPLFRAKNSNTHRHLTEYTGLDLEIEIQERHHEVLHVIDDTLKAIFKGVYERNERDGILAHDFEPA